MLILTMSKRDARYDAIKPLFDQGEISSFKDIFAFVPAPVVAADLGKRTSRFMELIDHPGSFKIQEIVLIGSFCNLTLEELFSVIEPVYPLTPEKILPSNDLEKYQQIRHLFDEHKIKFFEDIFSYVSKPLVAADLGKNRSGFGKRISTQIKKFPLKELVAIGKYCNLSLHETFTLIEAEYQRQNGKPKTMTKS